MIHDSQTDVSTVHRPTPLQAQVIDILGLNPGHRELVRTSLATWHQVERLCDLISLPPAGAPC